MDRVSRSRILEVSTLLRPVSHHLVVWSRNRGFPVAQCHFFLFSGKGQRLPPEPGLQIQIETTPTGPTGYRTS